ncbi:tyrosine-type recombinase/integrase [Guyparkeria halophila]|uniref:Tyrosine-type recombinase/integrase n=1 Tax=Guyparkeria halophila TaxID=47960 RepID=A0A6I6D1R2_9GAMM|nr:site-specific integrase [Guyparkeria halophila]QGT78175.1 tyrosine-type recombinase/integrase [Guyparkeria halophila]
MQVDHDEKTDQLLEEIGFQGTFGGNEHMALRKVLRAILAVGSKGQTISPQQLTALRKREPWLKTDANAKRLGRLLTGLNRVGWKCAIPPQTVKPPRPMALPATAKEASQSAEIHRLEQLLRRQWQDHASHPSGRLFLAGVLLVTRVGTGDQVACGILSRLRVMDVHDAGPAPGRFRTPIHGAASHAVCHEFVPPEPLKSLLLRQRKRRKRLGGQALLFGDATGTVNEDSSINDTMVRRLLNEYLAEIKRSDPAREHEIALPRTWSGLVASSHWLGREHGVPPAILQIPATYPLPKSALDTELWFDPRQPTPRGSKPPPDSVMRLGQRPQRIGETRADQITIIDEPRPDWGASARLAMRQFLHQVEKRCMTRKGGKVAPSKMKAFDSALSSSLDEADQLAPSGRSVLHLGLHWLGLRLGDRAIAVSTALTYLGRIFQRKLFDQWESLDMATWDDETVDEITAQLISDKRWSTKTQQDFMETWMQFLRFCASEDIQAISPDDLPSWNNDGSAAARPGRRTIITPFQFDHVLDSMDKLQGQRSLERDEHQAILILGFYAGLRSSEVLNLTAADVLSTHDELRINVLRSKTPAGRRAIPLHLILPSDRAYQPLARWVAHRQARVRNLGRSTRLDDLPLFGPLERQRRPSWDEVIERPLDFLRECLQTDIDFHGLRHSAASWLVLRAYAAYHSDFKQTLRHGDHPSFQDPALGRLREFFELFEPKGTDGKERMLVHIAKVLGHSTLQSLMLTYAHTLGPIQSHALRTASTWSQHLDRIATT